LIVDSPAQTTSRREFDPGKVGELEQRIDSLTAEVANLREQLEQFKKQFE
jgi:uncharacterized small protein (DUF1192 family)